MDFRCTCGAMVSIPAAPGAVVRCPTCGQAVQVPGGPGVTAAPPSYAPTYGPGYAPPAPAQTCGLAIAALVLGCLSLIFNFLTGIPAVILGAIGLSKIKKSQGRLTGSGMAIAGLVIGIVLTLVGGLVILGAVSAWLVARPVVTRTLSTTTVKARISEFEGALDRYKIDCDKYPTTDEGLTALVQAPSDPDAARAWHGPYLAGGTVPRDPWGSAYVYKCPGEHNTTGFDLSSPGPDRQPGTSDDVTNWENAEED